MTSNEILIFSFMVVIFVFFFILDRDRPVATDKSCLHWQSKQDLSVVERQRKIKEAEEKYAKIKREAEEEEKRLKRQAEEQEEMIRFKSQIWVI